MNNTKELLTIEFRYNDVLKAEWDSEHKSKKITIGVFDTLDEAIIEGNKALEILEKHFDIHVYPTGIEAKRDRFGKTNGCFGSTTRLVTNLAYLKTPFSFYINITKLIYDDIEQTIINVLEAGKRYKEYKKLENEK